MATPETTVGVVLDRNFGDRLHSLAPAMPVWVIDTPLNRSVAAELRPARNLTTFVDGPAESAEAILVGVLWTIDLHHGPLSQDPPYEALEVFGVVATPAVRRALREYGLLVVSEAAQHFVAERPGVLAADL